MSSVVIDPTENHVGTVIFLHGLGDDPRNGWVFDMYQLSLKYPGLKFILPTAPTQKVTLNGGMKMTSWHDIVNLRTIDNEEFAGINESKKIVENIIEEEIQKGTPSNKIVLGGFSQGAAMSLFVGYQFNKPLAGIIALSGYLPKYAQFDQLISSENKTTPSLICHGTSDSVVSLQFGKNAFETIQKNGLKSKFLTYERLGHAKNEQETKDMEHFLKEKKDPLLESMKLLFEFEQHLSTIEPSLLNPHLIRSQSLYKCDNGHYTLISFN